MLSRVSSVVCALAAETAVLGCPVCDSEQGKEVRAGVFDEQFGSNLMRVLLPFPIAAGVLGTAYVLLPTPRRRDGGGDRRTGAKR
jgi:hypothetical protein